MSLILYNFKNFWLFKKISLWNPIFLPERFAHKSLGLWLTARGLYSTVLNIVFEEKDIIHKKSTLMFKFWGDINSQSPKSHPWRRQGAGKLLTWWSPGVSPGKQEALASWQGEAQLGRGLASPERLSLQHPQNSFQNQNQAWRFEIEPGWNYIFKMSVTLEPHVADRSDASQNDHKSKGYASKNTLLIFRHRFRRRRQFRRRIDFSQTLSSERDLLDLFVQPLLLDMISLGTPQLRGGVHIFFFLQSVFCETLYWAPKGQNLTGWNRCKTYKLKNTLTFLQIMFSQYCDSMTRF